MKLWTLFAVALLGVLYLIGSAITQPRPGGPPPGGPGGPPPGGPGGLERVLDELKLSDKQKTQAQEILRTHQEKMRRLHDKARQELLEQLKEALGDEKFRQFQQALEKQRPARPQREGARQPGEGRRPGGPPPGGPGRGPGWDAPGVLEESLAGLKLNDKQKTRLDQVVREHHQKVRKAVDEEHEDLFQQMKTVLSDEQLRQFRAVFDRRPQGPPRREARGVDSDQLIDRLMAFDRNKDGKISREELPERMHALFEQGDSNKDGFLDRQELLALAAKSEREDRPRDPGPPPGRGPGGPPPGPGGLERVLEELKLDEKQQTRAEEILQAHHEKMRRLHDKARQELLAQMKEVLGEEQFRQFQRAMENQRPGGPPPR